MAYTDPADLFKGPLSTVVLIPWRALADYQINTARYAFEAQIQQQPHASLPRIGLALSTALSGDLNAGAFAMEDAWLSDTSDVRYFRPSEPLMLVVEELLLSYQGDCDDDCLTALPEWSL